MLLANKLVMMMMMMMMMMEACATERPQNLIEQTKDYPPMSEREVCIGHASNFSAVALASASDVRCFRIQDGCVRVLAIAGMFVYGWLTGLLHDQDQSTTAISPVSVHTRSLL